MSCSQFIEHEKDKSDTLVIIVNGDGTVTVDPLTLERVLKTQQHRAAVSFIRFENTNEPDSQTEKVEVNKDDKAADVKDKPCRKVNLVVEGYYPTAVNDKNSTTESVVSSTVGTPPLPQTTSEFLDLLSEGLDIPVSHSPTQSNMHATAGCLGDSLVDAFSEMAPEQLKQVETALHSEKAKQILGDDVTSVLDTLKLNEEQDDWVHFDHCYTNIYGSKKQSQPERVQNVVVQNSDVATMLTIKMVANDESSIAAKTETTANTSDTLNSGIENVEVMMPENIEMINVPPTAIESADDNATSRKKLPVVQNRPKVVTGNKVMPFKGVLPSNGKELLYGPRRDRPTLPQTPKVKQRKSKDSNASKNVETLPERIVTEDEVDGVKVFKPTRNDKKSIKPLLYKDGLIPPPKPQLVQSKLNFGKKANPSGIDQANKAIVVTDGATKSNVEAKKDPSRKPGTPITPETFGPALFSTPDIIRKITDEPTSPKSNETPKATTEVIDDQTAEIEKRMSAMENGEAILEQLHLEMEMQKELERITSQSDDDKLLSDLENSADEDQMDMSAITAASTVSYQSSSKNLDLEDSESENSASTSSAEKTEGEYEDDPNKLWCVCNKPHSNRFMICCDACDNWFHGSCVGISKAMGEKMEQNGTEWLCPSCKKEKSAKERENKFKQAARSTTSRLASRHSGAESTNTTVSSIGNVSTDNSLSTSLSLAADHTPAARRKSSSYVEKPEKPTACAECKAKEAMPGAAYCSHECILAHVTNSLHNMNSGQRIPLSEDRKIIVVDRRSGHRISGLRAPAVSNLREWLLQHPSYEIVRPSALPTSRPEYPSTFTKPPPKKTAPGVGRFKDSPVIKSRGQLMKSRVNEDGTVKPNDSMMQVSMKQFLVKRPPSDDDKKDVLKAKMKRPDEVNVAIKDGNLVRKDDPRLKDKQRQIKLIPVQPLSKPEEPKDKPAPIVTKKILPSPPVVEKKKKIETPVKEKVIAKKVEMKKPEVKKKEPPTPEPSNAVTHAPDAVRENVRKVFNDLFLTKMKASNDIKITEEEVSKLVTKIEEELFNMFKDTGNKYKAKYRSLLFNIKEPQNSLFQRIAEKSLSPYELVRLTAEEMACAELAQWRQREAKHEIDMIKKTELENLNQAKVLVVKTHKGELEIESETLPPCKADLIVPDLQSEDVPEEKDKSSKKTLPYYFNKEKERNATRDKSKDDSDRKERDRDKHRKHEHKDKHKSKKSRHRSSEREKHRSRSRRRSRSPDKDRRRSASAEKSSHRSRSVEKSHRSDKDSHDHGKRRSRSRSHKRRDEATDKAKVNSEPENLEQESKDVDEDRVPAELLNPFKSVDVDLSDMEPTSTVTIKTPPYAHSPDTPSCVWKGQVSMPDVAKFYTILKEVSGNCEALDEDLPSRIECVGRIEQNTVWDYISKVKKSGSKEILVVRFDLPESEEQNYMNLYVYLSTKNRMAVVGDSSPAIKDFYIMPLPSHSPVPQVLLPLDGPGFEDTRPHLLLGILVRNRRKKYFSSSIVSHPSTSLQSKKTMEHEPYVPTVPQLQPPSLPVSFKQESFTPPHSPTSVFVNTQVPITTSIAKKEEDEPYSPEDDEPYSPGGLDEEQCKSEMEDASGQLEESKQEDDSANSSVPGADADRPELYSPSEHFFNDIESEAVTLPADLQKLINSFKNRANESTPPPTSGTILEADPIVDAYKKSADKLDEDVDDAALEETSYSPPPGVVDDGYDYEEDENDVQNLDSDREEETKEPEPEEVAEKPEIVEEVKSNRDPRRKAPVIAVETFKTPAVSQPPPPGMEDEFSPPGVPKSDAMIAPETGYTTQIAAAPYAYSTAQPMQPYAPLIPQMYMAAGPVYTQGTLPFTAIPPPQIYVPPPMMHRTDPSLIPLPMENPDTPKKLEKRKMDEEKGSESDDKKSDSKSKKHKSYYSDSKGSGDSRSPTRHHSSSYDSHRRGYQRDDVEYGSGSRYSHKYSRSYRDRGDRGGYWKSGSDYSSSSSSSHKKYSHSSSSDRDRSSSSRRNRWDSSSKHDHDDEDWDEEIDKYESKKDKEKSEHSKKSESSKHS